MGRQPLARKKILDAAKDIVMDRGSGALTFEELVEESGVTRGGITYHFRTKQELLTALVAQDLEQWEEIEAALRPADLEPETADLIAFLRSHTSRREDKRRLVAGMMTAFTHDPPVLDPIREHERERLADIDWTDQALAVQLLRFAAIGLFWSELFGCTELPPKVRKRLVEKLESLARVWSDASHDVSATTGVDTRSK
ncbi:MAG: TetR/AcrR family transcriptional regulator [Pseudomonadota bacterium]